MVAACTALDFPVVSGNVSLYNETERQPIQPTPTIGGLGVLADAGTAVGLALPPGCELVLIGTTAGHLGQSLWLREVAGREEGPPPPVDLAAERRNGDFVRRLILSGEVLACHDVSDGGVLVAVAEMALAGNLGAELVAGPDGMAPHEFWFGEDQARYVLAVDDALDIIAAAEAAGVPAATLGFSAGRDLTLPSGDTISLSELRKVHEHFMPALMGG
jgi:phosphoribosylformylglycinamidine synthase